MSAEPTAWAFGVLFGLAALGLLGAVLALRAGRRSSFSIGVLLWSAATLVFLGILGGRADSGPLHLADLSRSALAEAAAEALLGTAVFFAVVTLGRRRLRLSDVPVNVIRMPIVGALVGALVLFVLANVSGSHSTSEVRDPDGTIFGNEASATLLGFAGFVTGLDVTPDGEVIFAEHLTGRIGLLVPEADGSRYRERTLGQVSLPPNGRLFHLVLDPGWPSQPYIYATAHEGSADSLSLSILRLTYDGTSIQDVTPLVSGLPTDDPGKGPGADHFGSAIAICDGYVFVSVGDTASLGLDGVRPLDVQRRVQLTDRAEGKVLRYALHDGALQPAGVLHDDPPVYAMGFRNPFGMTCDPERNIPIVVDNGPNGHDQLRLVEPGSNHEWPLSDERSDLNPPLFDSGLAQLAPTSVVARATEAGTEIIFGTFHTHALYRPHVASATGATPEVELVLRTPEAALAMTDGADGCVYFSDASRIWRLDWPGCDRPAVTFAPDGSVAFEGPIEDVYQRSCAACHGFERTGGQSHAPPLTKETLTEPDEVYLNAILAGRPESVMPAWAAAGMTVEQARRLLDYLRSDLPGE